MDDRTNNSDLRSREKGGGGANWEEKGDSESCGVPHYFEKNQGLVVGAQKKKWGGLHYVRGQKILYLDTRNAY